MIADPCSESSSSEGGLQQAAPSMTIRRINEESAVEGADSRQASMSRQGASEDNREDTGQEGRTALCYSDEFTNVCISACIYRLSSVQDFLYTSNRKGSTTN